VTHSILNLKSPEKIRGAFLRWGANPYGEPMRRVLPDEVRELLDASGLPWTVVNGSRHFKVIVNGRFVAILPHSKPTSRVKSRAHLNMLAQLRRAIRSARQ